MHKIIKRNNMHSFYFLSIECRHLTKIHFNVNVIIKAGLLANQIKLSDMQGSSGSDPCGTPHIQ